MKKIILVAVSAIALSIMVLTVNYLLVLESASRISEGRPITHSGARRQALLVIDIQEGLTGRSSTNDLYTMKSEELIGVVNRVIDSSASNNIPIIYVKNEISNPLINLLNDSMAKGSPGAELDSRLRIVSHHVISKDKGDAFSNPLLDSLLTRHQITRLVLAGLDLAHCVNSTALAAANRHYDICLLSDALLSDPDALKEGLLEQFKRRGFDVLSSKEYLQTLHR